jgi:hypothetical protein
VAVKVLGRLKIDGVEDLRPALSLSNPVIADLQKVSWPLPFFGRRTGMTLSCSRAQLQMAGHEPWLHAHRHAASAAGAWECSTGAQPAPHPARSGCIWPPCSITVLTTTAP